MKKLMIGTGLAAMLIASGVAVAAPGGMGRGPMGGDANKDGILTRAELTTQLEARFAKMDVDGDGQITQKDRDARQKARADKHFKQLDADGNGQISRAEFDAAQTRRAEAREQFREKRAEKRAEAQAAGEGQRAEGKHRMRGKGRMHHGGMHGRMGGMMDANKDGVITKQEFMAPALAHFDRMDANKDGQVTKEERQAAREAMRAQRTQQQPR